MCSSDLRDVEPLKKKSIFNDVIKGAFNPQGKAESKFQELVAERETRKDNFTLSLIARDYATLLRDKIALGITQVYNVTERTHDVSDACKDVENYKVVSAYYHYGL